MNNPPNPVDERDRVLDLFNHHPPRALGVENAHAHLRQAAKRFAEDLLRFVPHSRERSLAITHLQTAAMYANAGVAIHMNKAFAPDSRPGAEKPADSPA